MAKVGIFNKIKPADIATTPFKTYKEWTFNQTNYSASFGVNILKGIFTDRKVPIGSVTALNEVSNSDGRLQKVVYYSIDHLYYRGGDNPFDQFGNSNPKQINKCLFESASVVSIPQKMYGEQIQLGSVNIIDSSISSSDQMTIQDDKRGNLVDRAINTGSMVRPKNIVGYWGFNEKYIHKNKFGNYPNIPGGSVKDRSDQKQNLKFVKTKFEPGIAVTGTNNSASGIEATFEGEGYLYTENYDKINFKKDDDFAISCWVNLPISQSNTGSNFNHLISKEGEHIQEYFNVTASKIEMLPVSFSEVRYPYSMKIYNQNSLDSGKLRVERNDGSVTSFITSSVYITGSEHHIVFNKTGSTLELYINGALDSSATDKSTLNTENKSHLFIGTKEFYGNHLTGSMDEIRFFNRGLSAAEVSSLSDNDYITGSAYNTDRVGNAFYKHGILVISDPRPKYDNVLIGRTGDLDYSGSLNGFDINFRAVHTIYENEIICKVKESEFNYTLNPTIRRNENASEQLVKNFATSSEFMPYITTIGLYDDFGRLLAVGKLSHPVPKRPDVDTTFIVKYDT